MKIRYGIIILSTVLISTSIFAKTVDMAPVTGFAREFGTSNVITDANVTILETGQQISLDANGHFGPIQWPVGKPITFVIEKSGYRTTQTATVIVPPEGLTNPYNNITLQPVGLMSFYMLKEAIGADVDETKCHVATTVTAYHKTIDDLPQGESGATVLLTPDTGAVPYYFDIFTEGPMKNYPDPFTRGLTQTTADGGVIFANLTPQDQPYVMTAFKAGEGFTQLQFICRPGMFINASPPQGPTVIGS